MPEGIPNVMNVGNYRKFVVLELKEAIELRKMLAFMSKMIPVPMSRNILEGYTETQLFSFKQGFSHGAT